MSAYVGQIAALGTSVMWTFTSILFTLSSQQVGTAIVNRTRLLFAAVFVAIMHTVVQGQIVPMGVEPFRWGWLAFSGVVGFAIGDGLLFEAFVRIGPRLTMLLMALAPVFSTVMGWTLLHESPGAHELLGILLAVGGVALVILERQPGHDNDAPVFTRHYLLGILFGLGAALGQASGLVASKLGLRGDFPALSGTLMRLLAATLAIWLLAVFRREAASNFGKLRANPRALLAIAGGAAIGPSLGVWLSLVAVQRAPLGIASTLMSLSPIILLPISRVMYRERIGARAIAGTLVAVAGTAILFL